MLGLVDSELQQKLGMPLSEYIPFMSTIYGARATAGLAVWVAKTRKASLDLVPLDRSILPDRVIVVGSDDNDRKINVEVYEPADVTGPLPVHINLHGGSFIMPLLGVEAEICRYLSDTLKCIVLDADYAKGPWHQAPHALDDVLSVIKYSQTHPDWLDASRLTVGGFSAGANLALLAAASLPKGTVRAVSAWYPPVDLRTHARELSPPPIPGDEISGDGPGQKVSPQLLQKFRRAYLPVDVNRGDPKVSPLFCEASAFPPLILVVGTKDALYGDCLAFQQKLTQAGVAIDFMPVPRAGHSWERYVTKGMPIFEELRGEAFRRTVECLKAAQM